MLVAKSVFLALTGGFLNWIVVLKCVRGQVSERFGIHAIL